MKVDLSNSGATVDAHDLGPLLGLDPSEVPAKMRSGEITSRSEQGVDEDAGRVRLTFWYKGQRVRLICDADGTVLKTTRIKAGT
ncbi:hypothetical protein AN191_01600 [Loktanella sp. 5RATIMAR09]|uniref:DUF6522 family protein n=1 Tax=Loktanella sp. 5RATIMAR09 TaxID=1225655 RepID=UPI0006EBACFD|nr:DUF6522 family protein [Loktanella sp. 5RATIMAR09]KQI73603.1 hypothetical protein AN191_01600 [Loktanella sp. 5RATIMAR09]